MNIMSKHEIIAEDEEIDINVDEDDPYDKMFNAKSESRSIGFSISHILSDNFGPKPVKIEPNQNERSIFRPFEMKNFISNDSYVNGKPIVQNPSSVFLSNFRLSEIFDYSTKYLSPQSNSDNSLRNSLFTSYPKIHQAIRNNQPSSDLRSITPKIQPLGGISKTISQIGQEIRLLSSSPSPTLETFAPSRVNNSSNSAKIQQSSTDSIDSDDCTSETSTSKDDGQKMWPAWVSFIFTHNMFRRLTFLFSLFNRYFAPDIPTDQVLVSLQTRK